MNRNAESLFGSLKNELVYHEDYKTRAEARQSIFEYMEVFIFENGDMPF